MIKWTTLIYYKVKKRACNLVDGGLLDGDVLHIAVLVEDIVKVLLRHILVHAAGYELHVHGVDHTLLLGNKVLVVVVLQVQIGLGRNGISATE
jgi:hypothetical protein